MTFKIKIKLTLVLYLMVFCLIACTSSKSSKFQPTEKDIAMDAVLVATANQLTQKYDVRCIGFAYSCMHQIKELGLRFVFSHVISEEQARKFLIDGAQIMVNEVKNNSLIQPYLSETGFSYKNVGIIAIIKDDNKDSFYPNLSMIMLDNGEIDYSSDDPEIYQQTQVRTKKMKKRESFDEALALVNRTENGD